MHMEIIRVENLKVTYPPDKQALKGISLAVDEGDFTVISGPNGCGKTTFLKCLNGLLKPTAGRVIFKGRDTAGLKPAELFSGIGYLFQDPNDQLFAQTVRQDVAFGPLNMGLSKQEADKRVDEALELLDIKTIQHNSIHDLSHGLKQRAALAGVLAMQPAVLLLDEPTTSLDPQTEDEILVFLKSLNRAKGLTIIMATHEVDLMPEFANQVAVFSEGSLVRKDSVEAVMGCSQCLEKGRLKLPLIARLFESLREDSLIRLERLPLTLQEARQVLKEALIKK